eukprot:Skav226208  [mRNA]  locus=scaffold2208:538394:540270:- [translate_table: standard]
MATGRGCSIAHGWDAMDSLAVAEQPWSVTMAQAVGMLIGIFTSRGEATTQVTPEEAIGENNASDGSEAGDLGAAKGRSGAEIRAGNASVSHDF